MRPSLECAECSVKVFTRVLENSDVSNELKMRALTRAMKALAIRMDRFVPPVEFANEMFSILRHVTRVDDPFKIIKSKSNQAALSILPKAMDLVGGRRGIDSIRLAALLSISGNTIDISTGSHSFSLDDLWREVKNTIAKGLDVDASAILMGFVRRRAKAFFIGDNAGEIVLDIPLLRILRNQGMRISYIVRGGPIANDATIEDAIRVGLDKEVDLLGSTGRRAFGIRFDELPKRTRRMFNDSDLVLAKGQSNYESLNWTKTSKPLFFLFKVKCKPIGDTLNLPIGSNVFLMKRRKSHS